jgi:protein HOOK3
VDDDVKNQTLQSENQRLLALQQRTNERIRELELSNEEKAGLLRAALLDRDNLTPELLELMRVELLQRVREQIERVVQATPETRPDVLETEATDIAKTVMESQAALDYAKKVSFPDSSPMEEYPAFESRVSTVRSRKDQDVSSTLARESMQACGTFREKVQERKGSISALPSSNAGAEPTALGKLSKISHAFRRRKRASEAFSETLFSQPSTSQAASSVLGVASNRLSLCLFALDFFCILLLVVFVLLSIC